MFSRIFLNVPNNRFFLQNILTVLSLKKEITYKMYENKIDIY